MLNDARLSHRSPDTTSPASRLIRLAGEVLLLGAVVLSPWAYGSIDSGPEFFLSLAIFGLAALWAIHTVLTGRFRFRPDVGSIALAGLVAWTGFQLLPLPEGVVGIIAPGRADWHRTLLPAAEEVPIGESGGTPRATAIPLSVNPAATRTLLARLLGLLVVYAAARNWLVDRDALPRLLWTLTGLGFALAFFAIWQAASVPPQTGYWGRPLPVTPYGPFLNRNHYPDLLALCAGGGLGLLLTRPENSEWFTGRRFGLALVVVGLLVSVLPTFSRGGILALAAAGAGTWVLSRVGRDNKDGGIGRLALAATVGVALVGASVIGLRAAEERFTQRGELDSVAQNRFPMWRNVLGLAPRFPLAGTGGGTFEVVEPTTRTDPRLAMFNFEYAHNEYLEALIEGGLVRFVLTVALAGGLLWVVAQGLVVRRDRSVGGSLLGLWFGLAAVVFHAVGEFAIHVPAVAVAAAAVAGYAVAAASDGGFVPHRVKVRRRMGRGGRGRLTELPAVSAETTAPIESEHAERWVAHGPVAWLAGIGVAAAALVVAADARSRARAAAYEAGADAVERGTLPAANPTAQRIVYAEARVAVRPDDPNGRLLAAEARLQASYEQTVEVDAAALGGAGGWAIRQERLHDGPDFRAAVAHLQAARRVSPVNGRVHARFGLLASALRGEPAAVHFTRAKRTLPADPAVWFAAGREAMARGDRTAGLADWRRSLELGGGRLADMLTAVQGMAADRLRTDFLPPDAAVSLAAADALYPDRLRQADERRPFLVAAVQQARDKPGATGEDWIAAAQAADELGQADQAANCWRAAVEIAPRSVPVRDAFARWLEREERWVEAKEQLRQLQRLSASETLQDRIEACNHALKLKRALDE